jgi:tRNA-2-methylthio-N6-dimethylallyladenosine synthase
MPSFADLNDNVAEKAELDIAKILEKEEIIGTKKLYLESYGCQMNFADSEV